MILEKALRALTFSEPFWKDALKSPNNSSFGLSYGYGGATKAGVAVDYESAVAHSAVYACVALISDDVSSMPLDKFRKYGETGRYQRPRSPWMKRANPGLEWAPFIQQSVASVLLGGNAYWVPVKDRRGTVQELYPLDPRTVDVGLDGGRRVYVVGKKQVSSEQIVHIPGIMLPGAPAGLSVVQAAKEGIGLALGAEELGARLFANGSATNVVLQTEQILTDVQAETLGDRWTEAHAGLHNAHKVAVLDRGAKANRLSMTNEEAQFIETRKFQIDDVCRWFKVPPFMIGSTEKSTSWGTGLEQQSIGYVVHTLTPHLVKLETALNSIVEFEDGPDFFVKFNVAALLRGDSQARSAYYKAMLDAGVMSPNEIRQKEDMNPIPGLDGHYLPQAQGLVGADGQISKGEVQ